MVRRALLLFAVLAAPASAQDTTCRWIGQVWTCNTRPTMDWNAYLQQQLAQQQQLQNQIQRTLDARKVRRDQEVSESYANAQNEIERQKAERLEDIRKSVGTMIAAGDCAGAESFALTTGQIELAGQVRAYCANYRP